METSLPRGCDSAYIESTLSSCITQLHVGNFYDHEITYLPPALTHLRLGSAYNKQIQPGTMPQSLTHLMFGYFYNHQLLPGTLPQGLQHLVLGFNFQQPIALGVLPNTLVSIRLGYSFNQPIEKGVLPSSLRRISFGRFNHPLDGCLPDGLTHLSFGFRYVRPIARIDLPSTLTHLTIGDELAHVMTPSNYPASLTHLKLTRDFNQPLENIALPQNLEYLVLGQSFNQSIASLPKSVKHLTIRSRKLINISLASNPQLETLTIYDITIALRYLNPSTRLIASSICPSTNVLNLHEASEYFQRLEPNTPILVRLERSRPIALVAA
eukprot:gene7699-9014_t